MVSQGCKGALSSFCLEILCFDRYKRAKQNLEMIGMIASDIKLIKSGDDRLPTAEVPRYHCQW